MSTFFIFFQMTLFLLNIFFYSLYFYLILPLGSPSLLYALTTHVNVTLWTPPPHAPPYALDASFVLTPSSDSSFSLIYCCHDTILFWGLSFCFVVMSDEGKSLYNMGIIDGVLEQEIGQCYMLEIRNWLMGYIKERGGEDMSWSLTSSLWRSMIIMEIRA